MCFELPVDIGRDAQESIVCIRFPPLQHSYETFGNPKWCKVKKQLPQDRSC